MPVSEDRAEAIRRVRKLIERAGADRSNEAAAARRLAVEIMGKFGITRAEVFPTSPKATAKRSRRDVDGRRVATGQGEATPAFRVDYKPGRSLDLEIGAFGFRWKLK